MGRPVEERDLWAAVVSQAADDINTEDYRSVDYALAVSFFIASGEWAASRQAIADCIELHVSDIERLGRAAIAARHVRDGAPPAERPRPVRHPVQRVANSMPVHCPALPVARTKHPPMPRLEPASPRIAKLPRKCQPTRDRNWWIAKFMAKHAA
jgi:hypothetical protein